MQPGPKLGVNTSYEDPVHEIRDVEDRFDCRSLEWNGSRLWWAETDQRTVESYLGKIVNLNSKHYAFREELGSLSRANVSNDVFPAKWQSWALR